MANSLEELKKSIDSLEAPRQEAPVSFDMEDFNSDISNIREEITKRKESKSEPLNEFSRKYAGVKQREYDYFSQDKISDVNYNIATRDIADVNRYGIAKLRFENYTDGVRDEDRLARQQTWYGKSLRGLAKFGGKTGIYIAGNLGNLVYGSAQAIKDGDLMSFIDNDLTSILDDAEASLDRNLVNYYTDEEKSMGALRKVLTTNFWADDFLGGMAFMTGAILPTIAVSALSGGTLAPAAIAGTFGRKAGEKALKTAAQKGVKVYSDDAFKVATQRSSTGMLTEGAPKVSAQGLDRLSGSVLNKQGTEILRNGYRRGALLGEKVGQGLDIAKFIGTSAAFEGSIEARGMMKESTQNYLSMYAEQHNGEQPSYEELSEYLKTLDKSAQGVFWGNIGVLSLTAGAVYGKFLGLPDLFGNASKRFGNKMIGLSVVESETVKGGVDLAKANWLQKTIGTSYGVLKKPLALGAVEMPLQRTLNQAGQYYTNSKYDIENEDSITVMDALKYGINDAYTSEEGASEMINGFLLGLLGGIPIEGIGTAARSRGQVQNAKKAGLETKGIDWSGFTPQGIGKRSYAAERAKIQSHVDTYNKNTELFRNLNRANSIMNFKDGATAISAETSATYSFIKAHEALSQYSDILGNYDFAVDNIQLSEQQQTDAGIISEADLDAYKVNLKEQFRNDYTIYKESKRVSDAVGLDALRAEAGLSEGNIMELSDAIAYQTMLAGKNGAKSDQIGKEIERRVGQYGLNDAMKMLNVIITSTDSQLRSQVAEYQKQVQEVEATQKEVQSLVTKSNTEANQDVKNQTVRKQQILTQRLAEMMARKNEIEAQINTKLDPLKDKFGELSETNSISISNILEKNNLLGEYIGALKASGRTREAQTLTNMANEFQVANLAANELNITTQRMFEDDFFKSSDGKSFMKGVLGKKYKTSESFKAILKENENDVIKTMQDLGVPVATIEQVYESAGINPDLSDREKYRLETLVRAAYISKKLKDVSEGAFDNIAPVGSDAEAVGEVINSTDQVDVKADTISLTQQAIDNIASQTTSEAVLEAYLDEVKKQLDSVMLPNSQQLKKNEENKAKVARLTALLAQLENGVVDKSALASEGIIVAEVKETVTDTEYNNFVEDGTVTKEIIDKISNKIINGEKLSARESAIFADNVSEVESIVGRNVEGTQITSESVTVETSDGQVINVSNDGVITIGDNTYTNTNSKLSDAVTVENGKDIVVTLTNERGTESVFRGEKAEAIADGIITQEINQTKNADEINREIDKIKQESGDGATSEIESRAKNRSWTSFTGKKKLESALPNSDSQAVQDTLTAIDENLTDSGDITDEASARNILESIAGIIGVSNESLTSTESGLLNDVQEYINDKFKMFIGLDGNIITDADVRQQIKEQNELENAITDTEAEIQRLQEEIAKVEEPINFTDNEAFQEYYDLLEKDNLTQEEEISFAELEDRINNWLSIMGVRAEGVDLTDVIKQLANFSSIKIAEGTGTREATPKEIQEDVNRVDKSSKQNYTYGLNFTGVFSKASVKGSETYHELSGLTNDGFVSIIDKYNSTVDPTQEITLEGRYTLQQDKNTIIIPQELAEEINSKGVLRIGMPLVESGTYYSLVLQPVTNPESGVAFEPIVSDYETNIVEDALMNVSEGSNVNFSVDFSMSYNKDLFDEALSELDRTQRPPKEEFDKMVEQRATVLQTESKTIAKINERITTLNSQDKLTDKQKEYLATALEQLDIEVTKSKERAENQIRKELGETSGKSLSDATKQKLRDNLNISMVNKDGVPVNTLKATRPNTGSPAKDSDYNKHISLRQEILKDIEGLVDAYAVNESGTFSNSEVSLPVKNYLPGAPNYLVTQTADGKLQSAPKEISADDLKKIDDNGYISNGKVTTKKGIENVNTMFVRTQVNSTKGDSKVKVPIVIIKRGEHNIAYPVEVSRVQELPFVREDFDAVYQDSSLTPTEKSIALNNMLAEMGVNVLDQSNSFITVGNRTTLTDSNYNNILDALDAKEYISSVEGWTSKETTMEQDLVGNAKIDLNLSKPFISPKLQLKYDSVSDTQSPIDSQTVKKESKKKAAYVGDEVSQKVANNIYNC